MLSNAEIANEVRVSTRTVKRRLSFMTGAGAISSCGTGDVKKTPGMTCFFLASCANEAKKRGVDEKVLSGWGNLVFVDTRNSQHSIYAAVFHNIGEADEAYRWIKGLEGGENTRMFMMREIISVQDWPDKEIYRHLNERSG